MLACYLSTYLSIYLSIYLSMHLPTYLSIYIIIRSRILYARACILADSTLKVIPGYLNLHHQIYQATSNNHSCQLNWVCAMFFPQHFGHSWVEGGLHPPPWHRGTRGTGWAGSDSSCFHGVHGSSKAFHHLAAAGVRWSFAATGHNRVQSGVVA